MQAANDIGLLHRDVKPQNILLDKKGNAKLLDFGLAKDTEALVSMLSMTGQSIGTPPYMSPEQHDGRKEIDIRSDLYSLGCTAYHMLTGKAPFPGPTASAFARQHCDDIPEPAHKINLDCPLNLSQVIDRLLAKKPENRHQSPTELIEDLNRVERGEVPLKLYKPKKSKKHNPLITWSYVAAAVIIVAGCFLGWNYYKRNNAKTVITEAMSDAQQMIVKHDFDSAKNVLDNIISEYAESNPEQVKQAEALRTKVIERHGKWIVGQAARERRKEAAELTRAESARKRKLHNCLRNAARLKNRENGVKEAEILVNKAYELCNTDIERAKVSVVEKKVQEALMKMRPWAAVADFTLDRSVEAKLTGSAVAVKLEQTLGRKYRLLTRNQVKKALRELQLQSSDLADKSKAKQFGKLVGAEYLISGSVIQLGREITVACQIFNIETGAIRQTAEVSTSNVNDFNYMIRDAAKILDMSNAEKRKYMNEKFNYPKHLKAGKAAFAASDYENAVRYFKRALNAKRTSEAENMLKLAAAKIKTQRVYNERKTKCEQTINKGNKLLQKQKWKEAEAEFRKAQKIPGYEDDTRAYNGIKNARNGAELVRKKPEAERVYNKTLSSAKDLYKVSMSLNKKDSKAHEKCLSALKTITDFISSSHYRYLSSNSKQSLLNFKSQAETYLKTLYNDPIQGQPYTIPDLGMKLVYVAPENTSGIYNFFFKRTNSGTPTKGYWIGKYEVTQNEYLSIIGNNPSHSKGFNKPVENVRWDDAVIFCKRLTAEERTAGHLPPNFEYRLPTEGEWEFAAQGGTKSRGYKYSGSDNIDNVAWYSSNSGRRTHNVGTKSGNELGIYDMTGNVQEWCKEWYAKGWFGGRYRGFGTVPRGGCCVYGAKYCPSAFRGNRYRANYRYFDTGFRIALVRSSK